MGLFSNKEMNHLYVFNLVSGFATNLITLFVPIFLYQTGYSIIQILFFFFLSYASFVLLAYPIGKIVGTIGKKHAILVSTPFMIGFVLATNTIPQASWLFFVAPILAAVRHLFFNLGYHLEFIEGSDTTKRGVQLSTNEIILILASATAPIIGGIISYQLGFNTLFMTSIILSFVSVIPLFLSKDTTERTTLKNLFRTLLSKKHRPLVRSYSGYAIESFVNRDVWPIYLIIILGTTQLVGGLAGITMFLAISALLVIGYLSDHHDKKKLLRISNTLYSSSWLLRIFAINAPILFVVDTLKNTFGKLVMIPWGTYSYEVFSKHNYFGHIVEREIVFNLARIIIIPLFMLVFFIDWQPFIISFILAFLFSTQYYKITEYT